MAKREKKSRHDFPLIGASEFCATMNSDETSPQLICMTLRRFAFTVHSQRLPDEIVDSEDGNDGESDSDEEDSDVDKGSEERPAKRSRKTEEWKQDTASYNVPFVGTNIAGGLDPVCSGEWPTGLLKAYISKSPLAVELTGDRFFPESKLYKNLTKKHSSKKHRQLPKKILKAYLRSLSELATVARIESRFVAKIVRNHLDDLLKLIPEHASLVFPVLFGLGPSAPRDIARGMEQRLDPRLTRLLAKDGKFWELLAVMVRLNDPVVRSCLANILKVALQNLNKSPTSSQLLGEINERFEENRNLLNTIVSKEFLQSLCRLMVNGDIFGEKLLCKLTSRESPLWRTNEPLLLRSISFVIDNGNSSCVRLMLPIIQSRPGAEREMMNSIASLPDSGREPMVYCSKCQRLAWLLRELQTVPPRSLKKQVLCRALQSQNVLVVYQTLVLLTVIVDKAPTEQSLHDLNLVLTVIGKLEMTIKSNMVLVAFGCRLISRCVEVGLVEAQAFFDWSKILPSGASFSSMPKVLQRMVLDSVKQFLECNRPAPVVALAFFRRIFDMLIVARSHEIYNDLRKAAIGALFCACDCCEYEATLWVDGLQGETIEGFCHLLRDMQVQSPRVVAVAQAWESLGLEGTPRACDLPSALLCCAVEATNKHQHEQLQALITNVVAQYVLYSLRPLGLASLVVYRNSVVDPEAVMLGKLLRYCQSLTCLGETTENEQWSSVESLLEEMDRAVLTQLLEPGSHNSLSILPLPHDCHALVHQLTHLSMVAGDRRKRVCIQLLTRLLPLSKINNPSASWNDFESFAPLLLLDSELLANQLLNLLSSSPKARESDGLPLCRKSSTLLFMVATDSLSVCQQAAFLIQLLSDFEQNHQSSESSSVAKLLYGVSRLSDRVSGGDLDAHLFMECVDQATESFVTVATSTKKNTDRNSLLNVLGNFILSSLRASDSAFVALMKHDLKLVFECCLTALLDCCVESTDAPMDSPLRLLLIELVSQGGPVLCLKMRQLHCSLYNDESYQVCLAGGIFDLALLSSLETAENSDIDGFPPLILSELEQRSLSLIKGGQSEVSEDFLSLLERAIRFESSLKRPQRPNIVNLLLKAIDQQILTMSFRVNTLAEASVLVCTKELVESSSKRELQTKSLALLLMSLPKRIRTLVQRPSDQCSIEVLGKSIEMVGTILGACSFPKECLRSLIEPLNEVMRSSLKYSMRGFEVYELDTLRLHCLDVVKTLATAFQSGNLSATFFFDITGKCFNSWLLEMITSHSMFRKFLVDKRDGNQMAQVKLLQIMTICLSQETDKLGYDKGLWKILMQCFEASMSTKDQAIRRFLETYATKVGKGCSLPSMNVMKWGMEATDDGNVAGIGGHFEWLGDAIELNRVRTTISNFPQHDTMPGTEVEEDRCDQIVLDDCRYSPAFVLPLVLAALRHTTKLMKLENPAPAVQIARSLCDKGAIGLSLASLCSNCSQVRAVALSVLGLLESIVDCETARKLSAWRDRPQLAMTMRAVHRAIIIMVAQDSHQNDAKGRIAVPQLPGLSAVFLAKASVVISRPGDPLFAAVNRCFLLSERDGGAFPNLNRLPIFMSLFCSSSTDLSQLSEERRFAMHLVKDGMMTPDCYRLLTACHAPEMLFTSIHARPKLNPSDDELETVLLLRTIRRILVVGGERASSHLVKKLGILGWLRSLGRNIKGKAAAVRSAALILIRDTVKIASVILTKEELHLSTTEFSSLTMQLSVGLTIQNRSTKVVEVSSVCQIVSLLTTNRSAIPNTENELLSVSVAKSFVLGVPLSSNIASSVLSVCSFRLRFVTDDELRRLFHDMFERLDGNSELSVLVAALKQVRDHAIIIRKDASILESLLKQLIAWRKMCFTQREGQQHWMESVRALVSGSGITELERRCFLATCRKEETI